MKDTQCPSASLPSRVWEGSCCVKIQLFWAGGWTRREWTVPGTKQNSSKGNRYCHNRAVAGLRHTSSMWFLSHGVHVTCGYPTHCHQWDFLWIWVSAVEHGCACLWFKVLPLTQVSPNSGFAQAASSGLWGGCKKRLWLSRGQQGTSLTLAGLLGFLYLTKFFSSCS